MVTARHHILTNEYRLNVSTNKTGDCLVRGYTMCGRSYTARRVKRLLWDLSLMVFGRKKRLSILLVSLFSLARISPEHFWRCEVANRRTKKKKKRKRKPKRNGNVPGAQRVVAFFVCPSPRQKMFVFCCFSFGRLLSPCALVKSRGQLKQQTVGGFVAACCSIRSLLIKGRHESWGQMMWKYLHRACRTKKKKKLALYLRASERFPLWMSQSWTTKGGFPVVKLVALMYPSARRWKNRHTVPTPRK